MACQEVALVDAQPTFAWWENFMVGGGNVSGPHSGHCDVTLDTAGSGTSDMDI